MCSIQNKTNQIALQKPQLFVMPPVRFNNDPTHVYSIFFQIKPPVYQVFPVDSATEVFSQLGECKITGRAVLQINTEDDDLI